MKRHLVLVAVGLGILLLALAAWAVDGVRWTVSGGRRRRGRPVTA